MYQTAKKYAEAQGVRQIVRTLSASQKKITEIYDFVPDFELISNIDALEEEMHPEQAAPKRMGA